MFIKKTLNTLMKKNLVLLIFSIIFIQYAFSQTKPAPTATENKMTDVLCNCVAKIDLTKISNKSEATAAYIDCLGQNMDILTQLAAERNMQITDVPAMEKLGVIIAENLMKANCSSFMKLSVLTVDKKNNAGTGITEGTFKRIDTKGFNYIVISEAGNEKSFIWLNNFQDPRNL